MKNLLLIGLLVCLTNACLQDNPSDETLKNVIKHQVRNRIDNKFSVGTIVFFLVNGREEYFVYGYSDTTRRSPITKKSVFEIGSISKTFTTLLLADLINKGELKLNDPIQDYFPDSVKIPEFYNQKITFKDLATHTSGLPRMPDNFCPKDSTNPYADYSANDLYRFLQSHKLTREKGKYEYSNLGMALLAQTIATVSGNRYEDMLQTIICNPLKMSATTTILKKSPWLTSPHAGTTRMPHWDFDVFAGAGAIHSNGEDMLKFVKAQMGPTRNPLNKSMELTQQPVQPIWGTMKIGLGWHIISENGDEIITHSGATAGYRSFVGFSKKTKKAIIIFNNSGLSQDDLGLYFFNPSRRTNPVKMPVRVSKETLKENVGSFSIVNNPNFMPPGSKFHVKLDGDQLSICLTGQKWVRIIPESETKFFSRNVEASVEFLKNEDGIVEKLTVHQDGQEISAKKSY